MRNPPKGLVYIVDDDDPFRDSLEWLLSGHKFEVQAFTCGADFIAALQKKPAGASSTRRCLILDIRMPEMSGLQVQEALQAIDPRLPIVFVTAHGDVPMAVDAIKRGAFDFIEKPFVDSLLIERIEAALIKSEATAAQTHEVEATRNLIATLSPRERQIMEMVIDGKLNKTIAYDLEISIKTVEAHRARVMEKLEARSLAQLVVRVHAARPTPIDNN
jgi:FixJ family two-component response regulator